jgi:nuclear transcription factor Y gamma
MSDSDSGSVSGMSDDDMEVEDHSQQQAKKAKVDLKSSSSSAGATGAMITSSPLHVPPPPVPPPGPESATMKSIHAKLDAMWVEQKKEVMALKSENKAAFKHQSDLPLARIKRVMKSDEDVRMISAEAPILFAKACEMFVLDLTIRCYAYSEHNKRGGLEREDVFQVLKETDIFDFLKEVSLLTKKRSRYSLSTNSIISQVLINHPVPKGS